MYNLLCGVRHKGLIPAICVYTFLCLKQKVWNTVILCVPPDPSRYRPPTFHVQAWYDEVRDYSFPYPQECNPYCPFRCSGPVCTHYTQVWVIPYHVRGLGRLCPLSFMASCSVLFIYYSARVGHQQSYWLCHQPVLQHERVGTDLGQSRLSCLQLLTKVSRFCRDVRLVYKMQG